MNAGQLLFRDRVMVPYRGASWVPRCRGLALHAAARQVSDGTSNDCRTY